ncbi:MAG: Gfo/Idh/MocA family oxidoreductase [Ignavibacteria bacterium]|nr:Gfo/Idh/MocA family oxidoreductase [Ignavibacteria bacterium]
MMPLKIGVIGTGHLGRLHARMLSKIDSADLVGVFDVNMKKSEQVAEEFGVKQFSSLDRILAAVDAVTIATDTKAHYAVAEKALAEGKHLFIEKPITSTVEDADRLARSAREKNLVVQVGHIERFNPAILALDRYRVQPMFIESHRLAQFNPRGTDVAVVLDLMIHDIDIILSFVDSPVERIEANGVAVVSDSVDIANARIQFENGCVANVTGSRISQRRMRKMRLFQPNEYISLDFSEGTVEVFRLVDADDPHGVGTMMLGELESGAVRRKIIYEQPEVKEVNALEYELKLFVEAITSGARPIIGADEGKRALEVAQTIMEKIHQQRLPGT